MQDKTQVHITVDKAIRNAITAIAEAEKRTFSQMAAILLAEALEARNALKSPQNNLKPKDSKE